VSEPDPIILNLVGERVALGPHRRDLLPVYQCWVNDWEVTRTLGGFGVWTREAEEAWFTEASRRGADVHFTIYERAELRPIGTTALHGVNHAQRTAEFGIMIGEKGAWGKGCGTETARLMLDYGFHGLGLHNIFLRVHGDNERAIRAYTRAGFRPIGRRREAVRRGSRTVDEVLMDCLSTEFQSPVMRRLAEGAGNDDKG
jgi:RimJ/RimL family protein N-acetyltransferase